MSTEVDGRRVGERWKDRQVWMGEVVNEEIRELEPVSEGTDTEDKRG